MHRTLTSLFLAFPPAAAAIRQKDVDVRIKAITFSQTSADTGCRSPVGGTGLTLLRREAFPTSRFVLAAVAAVRAGVLVRFALVFLETPSVVVVGHFAAYEGEATRSSIAQHCPFGILVRQINSLPATVYVLGLSLIRLLACNINLLDLSHD